MKGRKTIHWSHMSDWHREHSASLIRALDSKMQTAEVDLESMITFCFYARTETAKRQIMYHNTISKRYNVYFHVWHGSQYGAIQLICVLDLAHSALFFRRLSLGALPRM